MSDQLHDSAAAAAPRSVDYRPIGNPMPVGFLGLMVASSTFAVVQLGWIPTSQKKTVAIVVLCAAVAPS